MITSEIKGIPIEYNETLKRWMYKGTDKIVDGYLKTDDGVYYADFNHHHELQEDQKIIIIDGKQFIADIPLIPLIKELNKVGIKTRTHCCGHGNDGAFIGIILDENTHLNISPVYEKDTNRTDFDGKRQLIISWNISK
jgi:hypothetical protein